MPYDLQITSEQGNCDMRHKKESGKLHRLATAEPERLNWWITQETKTGQTFSKRRSFTEIKLHVLHGGPLFTGDGDEAIPCHCTD